MSENPQGEDPISILVERLREMRGDITDAGETYEPLCGEAAEAIQTLSGALEIQGTELTRALEYHKEQADALLSLQGRVEELEKALEPFASIPPVDVITAAHYWCVIGNPNMSHFAREHLSCARAALNKDQF